LFDECDLFDSVPVFEFGFAGYGVEDVAELFVVDESVDFVAGSVGTGAMFAVLCEAFWEIIRQADVEVSGAIGEDIDVEEVIPLGHAMRIEQWLVRKKQIPPLRCGMTRSKVRMTRLKGANDKIKG
jgi:hypothetical protein